MNMTTNKKDTELIDHIATRAVQVFMRSGVRLEKATVVMQLTICHANGCPLRLNAMLDGDDFNLVHDVSGISQYLDYITGKISNHFLPRYADTKKKAKK